MTESQASGPTQPHTDWLRAAIGAKADWYLARFARIDSRGAAAPTWNWPAFFASTGWFFYRGMPGWALLGALTMSTSFAAMGSASHGNEGQMAGLAVFLALFLVVPAYANALYYRRLKKVFRRKAAVPPKSPTTLSLVGAIIGGVAIPWMSLTVSSGYVAYGANRDYMLRSRTTELIAAASACKTFVAEFYQAQRRMPADAQEAGCSNDPTPNTGVPNVSAGRIEIAAAGRLRSELERASSGIDLHYSPVCDGGACSGAPIVAWDCKTGTTVTPKFLPVFCR